MKSITQSFIDLVSVKQHFLLLSILITIVFGLHAESTTVFYDSFDRSSFGTTGGTPTMTWTVTGPAIVNMQTTTSPARVLQLYNTNTAANTGTPGRSYITGSLSNFSSVYKSKLKENASDVIWTFNMRASTTAGTNSFNLGNSNYKSAVVLVSTSSDLLSTEAQGYAVTLQRGTSTYAARLIRFTGGLGLEANTTEIITSGIDETTNYLSIKVVYSPQNDSWQLYARNDGSSTIPQDPTSGTLTQAGTGAVDNTYTSTTMTSCGFFFNHGINILNTSAKACYDNFKVVADLPSTEARLSEISVDKSGGSNYVALTKFNSDVYSYKYYLTKNQTVIPTVSTVKMNAFAANPVITPATSLTGSQSERTTLINVIAQDGVSSREYSIEFIKTENEFLSGLNATGNTTQGSGWKSILMMYSTDNGGNDKYQGNGYARCLSTSTLSTLTLPKITSGGVGTLSFYAKKIDANVVGTITISTKIDKGSWTQEANLGDINSLVYSEYTVPVNKAGVDSMFIRLEVTKNGDTFPSAGYYFDDFAYTAIDYYQINTSTSLTSSGFTDNQLAGMDITLTTGEFVLDRTTSVYAIHVQPSAKLTLNSGSAVNSGKIYLESNSTGTATFVDENSGVSSVSGNVQQYLPSARNWYVTSPITSATVPANSTYFGYQESGDNVDLGLSGATAYWKPYLAGTSLTAGKGYIAQPSGESTLAFDGTFTTGNTTVQLSRTALASKPGYNLVGNPYPSYLDWSLVAAANTNVLPTAWFRTKKTTEAGGGYTFSTVNVENETPIIVSNNANTSITNLIPPMQAYWVRLIENPLTTNYTVANNMRAHRDDSGNKFKAPKQNNLKLIRLQVSNGTNTDETVLYFNANALDNFDRYDSPKMFNYSAAIPEIYTLAGNEKLVINGMSELKTDTEIPLGFVTGENKIHSLTVAELKNINQNTYIALLDKQKNIVTELNEGTNYSFSADVTPATTDRFSLLFRAPSVPTEIDNAPSSTMYSYVNAAKQIVLVAPEKSNYTICNALGQKVNEGTTSYSTLLTPCYPEGMYVVKIGNKYSTRVIIK